jgi:hypothetical protein
MDAIGSAFDRILLLADGAFAGISGLFAIFSALFRGDWEGFWDAIKDFIGTWWENIQKIFGGFFDFLSSVGDVVGNIWDFFTGGGEASDGGGASRATANAAAGAGHRSNYSQNVNINNNYEMLPEDAAQVTKNAMNKSSDELIEQQTRYIRAGAVA